MKLGTKIQLYITVMSALVVILINTFVYFSYKNFTLDAEMSQLEGRGINIMQELRNAVGSDANTRAVLQSHLLSDGFITLLNETGDQELRITTSASYPEDFEEYNTGQYRDVVTYNDIHFVMVSLPIIWEDGEVYNLQIYENIEFLYDTFNILQWILLISTLIILIVIYFLNRIITNIILKPINKLIEKIKETENTSAYTMLEVNINDTKELKDLSESFNEMMLDLKENDEQQQAFIMNASHELKTPITVIDSYSQMLKRFGKTREDILDESIFTISDEAKRMKYLTEQLLSFSKAAQAKENFRPEKLNLVDMISGIKNRLEPVYGRNIDVHHEADFMFVTADADSLDQLLKIFLDNAYKYSSDDININITKNKEFTEVDIIDRGIGIPAEDLGKIFNRFYRVDKARARKTGGSGLGLSIADELAKMNDILVSVESTVDEGTTFTLKFEHVREEQDENR